MPAGSLPVTARGRDRRGRRAPARALLSGDRPALGVDARRTRCPTGRGSLLLALPPLAAVARGRPLRAAARRRRGAAEARSDLRERRGGARRAACRALAPDPDRRFGPALAAAVRAAGADAELAARVTARARPAAGPPLRTGRARDRRRGARGRGAGGGPAARRLAPRAGARRGAAVLVLLVVAGRRRSSRRRTRRPSSCTRAARSGPRPRASPAAPPTSRPSRRTGTTSAPRTTGSAPPGRAEAAWLRARRLDPRGPAVRRALALTPPPDAASARWTWSPPVTPEELLLLGGARLDRRLARLGRSGRGYASDGWSCWSSRRARSSAGWASAPGIACRSPSCSIRSTLRLCPHGRAPALGPRGGRQRVRLVRRDAGLGAGARAGRPRGLGARTRRWPRSADRLSP